MPGMIKFRPSPFDLLVLGYTTGVDWVGKLIDFPGNLELLLTSPHLSKEELTLPFNVPVADR